MSYDPAVNLTHYPMPMSQYGSNQYGEALYRIVFAESVCHLVGGRWPDGALEYRWTPTYNFAGWILERWHSPEQFTRMTQKQWDLAYSDPSTGFLLLGPYPSRGAYAEVHRFSCAISDANVDKLVKMVEQSQKNSWQDIRDANSNAYEQEEKDLRAQRLGSIEETRRAHGHRPMAGPYAKYNSKTVPDGVTAEQLGLPTSGNKFITRSV